MNLDGSAWDDAALAIAEAPRAPTLGGDRPPLDEGGDQGRA
jgi:hypothetical protein